MNASLVRKTRRSDRGMTTAEYAVGTVAVITFGSMLIRLYQEPAIHDLIMKVIDALILTVLHLIP